METMETGDTKEITTKCHRSFFTDMHFCQIDQFLLIVHQTSLTILLIVLA